jgi:hypothetical protein
VVIVAQAKDRRCNPWRGFIDYRGFSQKNKVPDMITKLSSPIDVRFRFNGLGFRATGGMYP